jgi:VIT1/CCC1 family predicted Fe2+/Mn2+ transporter
MKTRGNDNMAISDSHKSPPVMKRSRAKIWIRTGILAVFGTLFGLVLYHDIASGVFRLSWALIIFLLCLPAGFWMRKLVPMQVHPASRHVTLSFDRIYFALIVLLVIIKAVAGNILGVTILADVVMCMILGLMIGRLSGICLRVRDLRPDEPSQP